MYLGCVDVKLHDLAFTSTQVNSACYFPPHLISLELVRSTHGNPPRTSLVIIIEIFCVVKSVA